MCFRLVVTVPYFCGEVSLSVSAVPKDASLFPTFLLVLWEHTHLLSSVLGSLGGPHFTHNLWRRVSIISQYVASMSERKYRKTASRRRGFLVQPTVLASPV